MGGQVIHGRSELAGREISVRPCFISQPPAERSYGFLETEPASCVVVMELAPHAKCKPFEVARQDAPHRGCCGSLFTELRPGTWCNLHVQRCRPVVADCVCVGFVRSVKHDRALHASARFPSNAFDIPASQDIGEERRSMLVIRKPRLWSICSLERMHSRPVNHSTDVASGKSRLGVFDLSTICARPMTG